MITVDIEKLNILKCNIHYTSANGFKKSFQYSTSTNNKTKDELDNEVIEFIKKLGYEEEYILIVWESDK